ncbi:MAG TPA: hypothetical protein VF699_11940 [Caulobacteraceae bacterium]|jgi:predicted RND superfamily exporter protein
MLVAAALFAVAGGVALVAASYALYALLRDPLGPAGAAGVVAAVAAVLLLLMALLMSRGPKTRPAGAEAEAQGHEGLAMRLFEVARGHPVLSVGALLAGLYVVAKRPGLLALLAANVLGAQRQKRRDGRA